MLPIAIWSFSVPRIHSTSYCIRAPALAGPFFPACSSLNTDYDWLLLPHRDLPVLSHQKYPALLPHPSHSITVSCFIVFLKLISTLLVYLVIQKEAQKQGPCLSVLETAALGRCVSPSDSAIICQKCLRITLKVTQVNQIHYSVVILNSLFEIFIPI